MLRNIDMTLWIKCNVDLSGVFGIDITTVLHIYVKGGGSYDKLMQDFAILQSIADRNVSQQQTFIIIYRASRLVRD